MPKSETLNKIVENNPELSFLKADGFDEAVLGFQDSEPPRLIYSVSSCIQILMEKDKMTREDAMEHFDYNVKGSYVGEQTPIWCEDNFE